MNWLDFVLLAFLGFAAVKGFMRGFIVELCALLGLVLGIWAGVHLNERASTWLGLGPDMEITAFVILFLAVLVGVHFLGRALTKLIDLAQLSLPNKLAGVVFGLLRSAFVLSVLLNVMMARQAAGWPPDERARKGSALHGPIRAFAPAILPALEGTKWVDRAMDQVEEVLGE